MGFQIFNITRPQGEIRIKSFIGVHGHGFRPIVQWNSISEDLLYPFHVIDWYPQFEDQVQIALKKKCIDGKLFRLCHFNRGNSYMGCMWIQVMKLTGVKKWRGRNFPDGSRKVSPGERPYSESKRHSCLFIWIQSAGAPSAPTEGSASPLGRLPLWLWELHAPEIAGFVR